MKMLLPNLTCAQCHQPITAHRKGPIPKFCSDACRAKDWAARHPERKKELAQQYRRSGQRKRTAKEKAAWAAARRRRRDYINSLKAKPCADCGGSFPPYVMDFDHRDWSEKTANIGALYLGAKERLEAELLKCDLVCSNCHRIRTHKQREDPAFRARLGRPKQNSSVTDLPMDKPSIVAHHVAVPVSAQP